MKRKGGKRKAKAEAEAPASAPEAEEKTEEKETAVEKKKTTNKAPRAKRVKASKPESEVEYLEDKRNLVVFSSSSSSSHPLVLDCVEWIQWEGC